MGCPFLPDFGVAALVKNSVNDDSLALNSEEKRIGKAVEICPPDVFKYEWDLARICLNAIF